MVYVFPANKKIHYQYIKLFFICLPMCVGGKGLYSETLYNNSVHYYSTVNCSVARLLKEIPRKNYYADAN